MNSLITIDETRFLSENNIRIDNDGVLHVNNQKYRITVLHHGPENKTENFNLTPEQLDNVAKKIAIILLKKDLLQTAPSNFGAKINDSGITSRPDNRFYTHIDQNVAKDTQTEYDALKNYLFPTTRPTQPTEEKSTSPILDQPPTNLNPPAPVTVNAAEPVPEDTKPTSQALTTPLKRGVDDLVRPHQSFFLDRLERTKPKFPLFPQKKLQWKDIFPIRKFPLYQPLKMPKLPNFPFVHTKSETKRAAQEEQLSVVKKGEIAKQQTHQMSYLFSKMLNTGKLQSALMALRRLPK